MKHMKWKHDEYDIILIKIKMFFLNIWSRHLSELRAGTHGEISFDSVDSRSSSVHVNVNYSHEHTVNS